MKCKICNLIDIRDICTHYRTPELCLMCAISLIIELENLYPKEYDAIISYLKKKARMEK